MSGSCGSCRTCTRPVWVKALTLVMLIDFYRWCLRLLTRRCPACKHGLGAHRTQTASVRLEQYIARVDR